MNCLQIAVTAVKSRRCKGKNLICDSLSCLQFGGGHRSLSPHSISSLCFPCYRNKIGEKKKIYIYREMATSKMLQEGKEELETE